MSLFLGTLMIVLLCCLAMSIGLIIDGKSLSGGCGRKVPGAPRCEGCPKKRRKHRTSDQLEGESEC
jgi:hypothetical protein